MRCPQCQSEISDRDPKCSSCGFDPLSFDERLNQCPAPQGPLNDFAGLLKSEEASGIKKLLEDRQDRAGHEVVVVTVPTTAPLKPEHYVFWLYNEWRVGGKGHKGVMILLALKERRVETEVGFGLEHILTDAESGRILDQAVVSRLKEGHYAEGLRTGVEAIIKALDRALQR